ncbi:MAG: molybdate ABC transporter permease subunit [Planctomycetes bacterium]|nr:molybdate ABC transporter permease subunit [Planctomycetota bacterium]
MSRPNSKFIDPLAPPRIIWIPAAIAALFLAGPIVSLVTRAPWATLANDLGSPEVASALALSLICSLAATALSVLIGFPLAWCFARAEFPARHWIRSFVLLPAVLPPVVGGVALLFIFGRRGLLGLWLEESFGVVIPFTTPAVVFAECYIAMPFFIMSAEAGLRASSGELEEAAATLGAGPWRRFIYITIPSCRQAFFAGAALAFARALGEFGATITFAGSLPGRTQTMPLAILLAMETRPDAAIAMSMILIVIALAIFYLFRKSARIW